MAPDSAPPARRRRRWLVVALVLVVALIASGDALAPYGSAVWERSRGGALRRTEGERDWIPRLAASYTRSEVEANRSSSRMTLEEWVPEQPTRLSSLSIVDISGTPLTRRVAHALAADARQLTGLERVDVRVPGDPLEERRLGDQILVLEEYGFDRRVAGQAASGAVDFWIAHVPEFGWGEAPGAKQRVQLGGSIQGEVLVFGSPLLVVAELADTIADDVDVADAFTTLREDADAAPPFPDVLVADAVDLGHAKEAVDAMGITGDPVYAGVRHARRGEALWRYEGPDAVERMERAMETLGAAGWTFEEGVGSNGVDERPHMRVQRKGTEFVRWQYQENRVGRLQQESWTHHSDGTTTHHVEGQPLDPVVWLYYRHEPTVDELEALLARAEDLGVADALLANLPTSQVRALGREVGPR